MSARRDNLPPAPNIVVPESPIRASRVIDIAESPPGNISSRSAFTSARNNDAQLSNRSNGPSSQRPPLPSAPIAIPAVPIVPAPRTNIADAAASSLDINASAGVVRGHARQASALNFSAMSALAPSRVNQSLLKGFLGAAAVPREASNNNSSSSSSSGGASNNTLPPDMEYLEYGDESFGPFAGPNNGSNSRGNTAVSSSSKKADDGNPSNPGAHNASGAVGAAGAPAANFIPPIIRPYFEPEDIEFLDPYDPRTLERMQRAENLASWGRPLIPNSNEEDGAAGGGGSRSNNNQDEDYSAYVDEDLPGTSFAMESLLPAVDIARERAIRDKLLQYQKALEEQVTAVKTLRKENREKTVKIEELKAELTFSEQSNKVAAAEEPKAGIILSADLFKTSGMDQQLQQRKKAEAKQQNMLLGDAFAEDEDPDMANGGTMQELSFFRLLYEAGRKITFRIARRLNPLQSDVLYIESRFGPGIAAFFKFFRWQVIMMTMVSVIVLCFQIPHYISANVLSWGSNAIPQWVLYSSFQPSESTIFIIKMVVALLYFLASAVKKIVDEDKNQRSQGLDEFDGQQKKFSRVVLNAWDHSVWNSTEVDDMRFSLAESLRVMVSEEKDKGVLAQRSRNELFRLWSRRVFANLIIMALIAGTWVALVALSVSKSTITTSLKSVPFISTLAAVVVPIAISVINAALPKIVMLVTEFEKWDEPLSAIKAQTFRLYLLKIFTVILLMLQFYQMLSKTSFSFTIFDETVDTASASIASASFACGEDEVASQLLSLLLTGFFLDKIIVMGTIWVSMLIARMRKKPYVRDDFVMSTCVIDLLYFQAIVWNAIPYAPFAAVVSAPLLYINFKFQKFLLTKYKKKPNKPWSAKDTSSFFLVFFVCTFGLSLVAYYYAFGILEHGSTCGPTRGCTFVTAMERLLESNSVTDGFYRALLNPLLLWAIIIWFLIKYAQRATFITAMQSFMVVQREKMTNEKAHLEGLLKKQTRDLTRLKQRMASSQ